MSKPELQALQGSPAQRHSIKCIRNTAQYYCYVYKLLAKNPSVFPLPKFTFNVSVRLLGICTHCLDGTCEKGAHIHISSFAYK